MSEPHPEHPIVLPPDVSPEDPHPEHPIVLPDEETPPVEEATLSFFQRITLGFNWNPSDVDLGGTDEIVNIDAIDVAAGQEEWRKVRSVPNSGSSSVTYAADFGGPVKIRVRGSTGSVSGDYTVT